MTKAAVAAAAQVTGRTKDGPPVLHVAGVVGVMPTCVTVSLQAVPNHASAGGRKVDLMQIFRPGDWCPFDSEFAIVTLDGVPTGYRRSCKQGKPMPPTPGAGEGFIVYA